MIQHVSFLFSDKGSRLMNYSRSTEDYRQLSVDYSDSNSISESTSLILSNRGHRRGKIFLKDYVYELWDYPCRSGDRCSHALLVTWLGRYSCAKLQRRKILLYLIPFYLCPTVKLYIPWLPCSSITSFFLYAPFARWSCSADHRQSLTASFWHMGSWNRWETAELPHRCIW